MQNINSLAEFVNDCSTEDIYEIKCINNMMILTENHRRVVSSALNVVEERIDKIEMFIHSIGKTISYIIENDLGEEESTLILNRCDLVKKAIQALYKKYEFDSHIILLSNFLNTTAAFNWKDLEETDTKSLLHYGEFISEETKFEIEKDLKSILALTEQLIKK